MEGLVKWVNGLNIKLLVIYNLSKILSGSFFLKIMNLYRKKMRKKELPLV